MLSKYIFTCFSHLFNFCPNILSQVSEVLTRTFEKRNLENRNYGTCIIMFHFQTHFYVLFLNICLAFIWKDKSNLTSKEFKYILFGLDLDSGP